MLRWFKNTENDENRSKMAAISRSQGVIEFDLDGTILEANDNFLASLGYTIDEVKGRHHRIFVDAGYAASDEYRKFWEKLRRGQYDSGQYTRVGKTGSTVWIQASYNPILDPAGRPYKVVKFATDITKQKLHDADFEGQVSAIRRSQAVIEFAVDGTILDANQKFLDLLGYSLDQVKGKHHRIFVDKAYSESREYKEFWDRLRRGEYDSGRYMRLGSQGRQVWIQASYNPILDTAGHPYKVVKFATDITSEVRAAQLMREAVAKVLTATREKDLSQRIDVAEMDGDIRSLCEGINELLNSMTEVLREVREASLAIADASADVSSGSQDMASRTESQAASLEQTAASMHEITATVKQNADNAQAANQLASSARSIAENGGVVVGDAVDAVGQIEESAKKISDIIGLIDEIAFQTNLLALNASVEAARAGDAGKGFAVVAQEVRALAQRSANASKDIKALIAMSNAQVKTGSELVGRGGAALSEIVAAIKKVSDIVAEISAASQEQTSGLEQVNVAVTSMDEATQRNGALVEQSAAAAEALAQQAGQLSALVQRYTI